MGFFLDLYGNMSELSPTAIMDVRTAAGRMWQCKIIVTDEDMRTGSCLTIQRHRDLFVRHFFPKAEGDHEELLFEIKTKDAGFHEGTHTFPLLWDKKRIGMIRIEANAPARMTIFGHGAMFEGKKRFESSEPFPLTPIDHKKIWMLFGIRSLYALVATLLLTLLVCTGTGTYVCVKLTGAVIEEMHGRLLKE